MTTSDDDDDEDEGTDATSTLATQPQNTPLRQYTTGRPRRTTTDEQPGAHDEDAANTEAGAPTPHDAEPPPQARGASGGGRKRDSSPAEMAPEGHPHTLAWQPDNKALDQTRALTWNLNGTETPESVLDTIFPLHPHIIPVQEAPGTSWTPGRLRQWEIVISARTNTRVQALMIDTTAFRILQCHTGTTTARATATHRHTHHARSNSTAATSPRRTHTHTRLVRRGRYRGHRTTWHTLASVARRPEHSVDHRRRHDQVQLQRHRP